MASFGKCKCKNWRTHFKKDLALPFVSITIFVDLLIICFSFEPEKILYITWHLFLRFERNSLFICFILHISCLSCYSLCRWQQRTTKTLNHLELILWSCLILRFWVWNGKNYASKVYLFNYIIYIICMWRSIL